MPVVRPSFRVVAATLLPLLLATCTEDTLGPIGRPGVAALVVQTTAPNVAQFAGLVITRVRGTVTKPNPTLDKLDTLIRNTVPFPANSNALTLDLEIPMKTATDSVDVTIEYLAGVIPVFSGTQHVEVRAGPAGTNQPVPVAVAYVGPGNNIESLTILPFDTTVTAGATLTYRVSAIDSSEADVPSFYVSWTSSSPANPITADGVLHAGSARATVTITATTPTKITNSTTVTIAPAPSTVVKVSGDAQTASVSTAPAQPIVVEVRGSDNLPIAGVSVAFASVTGGGSVDSASGITAANGRIGTTIRLGPTAGAQTYTATVTGAPVATFNETATAVGPTDFTWTGATSTDWNTAGNWSPAAVPTAADNAIIANTTNKPTVSSATTIANLTVNTGATLTVGNVAMTVSGFLSLSGSLTGPTGSLTVTGPLTTLAGSTLNPAVLFVGGNLVVAGTYGVASTNFIGLGQAMPPLAYQNVAISGSVSLTARTSVASSLNIIGGGLLNLAGHTLVTGLLQVGQAAGDIAQLRMTNGLDSVIAVNVTFQGGDETGLLTAGVMRLTGTFNQTGLNSPQAFAASGIHKVVLAGTTAQTVNQATPAGAQSHFNDLDISSAIGFIMTGNIQVNGQLISLPASGTPAVTGTIGQVLTARGVNVSHLSVTNSPMIIGTGSITRFDSVTFSGQAANAIALSVNDPGSAAHYSFTGLHFLTTPSSGAYLRAFDTDGVAPVLTVDMVNPTPATPGAFTVLTGGAVINWPAAAPTLTWNGVTSSNWSVASNWTPNQVPTATNDVTIPAGTPNAPAFTLDGTARNVTVASGVAINLGLNSLTVSGNLANSGTFQGTGQVVMVGTGSFSGVLENVVVSGANFLSGTAALSGNLTITGVGASLDLAGAGAGVTGNLSVQGGGKLIETNPASTLTVGGSAVFDGASEAGFLTAGDLIVLGNFTQSATSSGESFSASGSHLTALSSDNPTVGFATPGSLSNQSRFQNLTWAGTGTLTQSSGITITGTLTTVSTTAVTFHGAIAGGRFLQFATTVTAGPLVFDNIRVIVNQTTPVGAFSLNNATFQGLATTAVQLTVQHPGLATPIVLNNLTFSVAPTGAGLYLSATDNTADANTLTLNLTGVTPATPGAFTAIAGGAVINWPTSVAKTWLGTTAAWTTASNWSPAGVPTASDDVTIPATANNPTTSTGGAVRNLTVASGAGLAITAGIFTAAGNIAAAGPISVDSLAAAFEPTGTARTISGTIEYPVILGTYTASGPLTISHNLQIQGTLGNLDVAAQTVTVAHDLLLQSAGSITMTNAAGVLSIGRNARFTGGSTAGKLTAGRIDLAGNLTQDNSGCACATSNPSFSPSGTQTVRLTGTTTQTIDIFNTGLGAALSHFNNLELTLKTGSVDFTRLGTTFVAGQLISTPAGTPAILTTSNAAKLQAGDVNVNGLTVNALPLTISGGGLTAFSRATFQGYAATDQQLTVVGPGAATPFVLTQLTFSTVPTGAGRYLVASDTLADANALTLDLNTPTPATDGGFTTVSGGAVINWPAAAPTFTWIGSSTNWQTASNWSTGAVPGAGATVVINPSTAEPTLSVSTSIGSLTVNGGATLTLNAVPITINGALSVAAGGAITQTGNGSILMHGTTIGGTIGVTVSVNAAVTVAAPLTLTGANSLIIISGGQINLAGHSVITPRFQTQGTGTLAMLNPLDTLNATQLAAFGGGAETTLLTAGELLIGDSLIQTGTSSTASFSASGTHRTHFNGNGGVISFSDPGVSSFNELNVAPLSGTVQLLTSAVATGNFFRGSAGTFALDSLVLLIQGNASSGGPISVTTGGLGFSGLNKTIFGNFGTAFLSIQNNTTIASTTSAGNIAVTAGVLDIGGNRLTAEAMTVAGSGVLSMTDPLDTLIVTGNLAMAGGSTSGTLTAGAILLGGDFVQTTGVPTSFAPSGTSAIVFNGTGAQTVHFTNPGAAASHFHDVVIANPSAGGVTVDSVFVLGSAAFLPALPQSARVIHGFGIGSRLVLSNFNITQTVFDNLAVSTPIDGSVALTKFDSVTFTNTPSADTALTVNGTGAGGPFTIHNLIFQTTPTGQGAYLRANDVDLTANGQLILNLLAPTPPTTASFVQQVNGALVNWPAAVPTITWTGGAGNSDWNTGTNWNTGTVPTGSDSVVVVNSTTTPSLVSSVSVGAINVTSGTITVNGQTLNVARSFTTSGTGTLTMTNAGGLVAVAGDIVFGGGSTAGRLTAGTLIVGGNFTESQTNSTTAFQATFGHQTQFSNNAGTRLVTMDNPGPGATANHFADVMLNPVSSVTLSGTPMFVTGTFTSTGTGSAVHGNGFRVQAAATNVTGMTFDNTPLQINSAVTPASLVLDNSTFQNMSTATDQIDIILPGAATPYVLNNLVFSTTPVTGVYLFASDILADANLLTVALANPNPGTSGGRVSSGNGAVIQWPAAAPAISWTGAVSSDWSAAGNWSGGVVPGTSDSVVIPATATTPVLSNNVAPNAVVVTGGTINLNGFLLQVNHAFVTTGAGTLTMTTPGGGLFASNLVFGGGSEVGLLTTGTIQTGGDFTQSGSTQSFTPSATGSLLVRFNGGTPHNVAFTSSSPTSAQPDFRNVEILGTGNVTTTTGFLAHGALAVNSPVTFSCSPVCQIDSTLSSVAGSTLSGPYLYFGGATMDVQGTYTITGTGFTGTNQDVPAGVSYTNIDIYGTATMGGEMVIPGDLTLLGTFGTPLLTLNSDITCDRFAARAGTVVLNGHPLNSVGNTITATSGTITMTDPGDVLNVGGDMVFGGGDESGRLTAGTITAHGNFVQQAVNSVLSFSPSGSHTVALVSSGAQAITFDSPGTAGVGSHFQVLDLSNALGGATLNVNMIADSVISTSNEAILNGGGSSLTMRRSFITGLTVNNAPIIINEGASAGGNEHFDNVIFQNMASPGTRQVSFLGVGDAPRTLSFSGISFDHISTFGAGELYVFLQPSAGTINLTMLSSSEGTSAGGNGTSFTGVTGNGTVSWP